MLRSFSLDRPFRCLQTNPFGQVGLGKKTVIYGHNGSGKSTLSLLLSSLDSPTNGKITWVSSDRAAKPLLLGPAGLPDSLLISVFNKEYVAQNLASFLDGADAAAIITLGDAVGARKEEDEISVKMAKLDKDRKSNLKVLEGASAASLAIVRSVQTSIESNLKRYDLSFTKNRYNEPMLRKLLATSGAGYPLDDKRIAAMDELGQPVPDAIIPQAGLDQYVWDKLGASTESLLREGVLSELLSSLVGEATLQQWVLEGMELHEGQHSCGFCAGPITSERRVALSKHFDESRQLIQNNAKVLMSQCNDLRMTLTKWLEWFPDTQAIHSTLRENAAATGKDQQAIYVAAIAYLDEINGVLKKKHDEPERTDLPTLTLKAPNFSRCSSEVFVNAHNELCASGDTRRNELTAIAFDNFVGSSAEAYRKAAANEAQLESEKSRIAALARPLPALLATARAKQFSSHAMAAQINADLASVYGRKHLRIEVSENGKAYRCWRDTEPATNLSEGEKNTLALIYFLRHLQDESQKIDPKKRIVVIDDPSSSLDRESVYATHSWLLKQLNDYGQYVILTHDFELLRLLLGSLKNQVGKSRSKIGRASKPGATQADHLAAADEQHFPAARFLEISAASLEGGSRSSTIEAIPDFIINHISEYHYFFDRVIRGIENPDEAENLFLLPNAARRMLESFSRFKRPDLPDFLPAMEAMTQDGTFRDVYDFCNKHSHGEGRELSQPLDRHSVKQQLERAVAFMVHVDADHVEKMEKAVGRDGTRSRGNAPNGLAASR